MIANGDRGAKVVQDALQHLDRYIAGTQLGITIASLALGWIGEPVLAELFDSLFRRMGLNPSPVAGHVAAAPIAFFILTFLHIVLGELEGDEGGCCSTCFIRSGSSETISPATWTLAARRSIAGCGMAAATTRSATWTGPWTTSSSTCTIPTRSARCRR